MRISVLLGALITASAVTCATAQPGQAQQSRQQAPPPDLTVAPTAPDSLTAATEPSKGQPANICWELVNYLREASATGTDARPSNAPGGTPSGGSSVQSAPPGVTAPVVDQPQLRSGIPAPIPQEQRKSASPQVSLEHAESMAKANDIRGCRDSAQKMRRAGVDLPPGLIALAALPAQ